MYYGSPIAFNTARPIAILMAIFLLVSCATKKNVSANTNTSIEKTPQIVFLNYEIEKKADGTKAIKLISTKRTEGKIKDKGSNENASSEDLICYQLNKKTAVISKVVIQNPLHKHIEYLDESKRFKVAQIKSDRIQFTVRMQLHPDTKYVAIGESYSTKHLIQSKVSTL